VRALASPPATELFLFVILCKIEGKKTKKWRTQFRLLFQLFSQPSEITFRFPSLLPFIGEGGFKLLQLFLFKLVYFFFILLILLSLTSDTFAWFVVSSSLISAIVSSSDFKI